MLLLDDPAQIAVVLDEMPLAEAGGLNGVHDWVVPRLVGRRTPGAGRGRRTRRARTPGLFYGGYRFDWREFARCQKHFAQAQNTTDGLRDLVWALLNTQEFITNH